MSRPGGWGGGLGVARRWAAGRRGVTCPREDNECLSAGAGAGTCDVHGLLEGLGGTWKEGYGGRSVKRADRPAPHIVFHVSQLARARSSWRVMVAWVKLLVP